MDYFWLTYNDNESEIIDYQEIAFIEGRLTRGKNSKPDLEQWCGSKGKIIKFYEMPIMEIARNTRKKKPTDFYYGPHIIVTEKVKNILDAHIKPNVSQFVPTILKKRYSMVEVACVNKEKTEYKNRAGIDYIVNPVLNVKDLPNIPIFLVLDRPGMIIINQVIYDLLIVNDIKGFFSKKVACIDEYQK
jgi:hypothetical protein